MAEMSARRVTNAVVRVLQFRNAPRIPPKVVPFHVQLFVSSQSEETAVVAFKLNLKTKNSVTLSYLYVLFLKAV